MNIVTKSIVGLGIFSLSAYTTAWGLSELTIRETPNSFLNPPQVVQNTKDIAAENNSMMMLIIICLILSSSVPTSLVIAVLSIYDNSEKARKKLEKFNYTSNGVRSVGYNRSYKRSRHKSNTLSSSMHTNQAAAALISQQMNNNHCHSE